MCGIVGYVGPGDAGRILMQGLHRLEYRGYDSAGIALLSDAALFIHKKKGKVRDLEQTLTALPAARVGIAHTRWATHGEPSDRNAHPHTDQTKRFALVHNGIIENAARLRDRLRAEGAVFTSDTDSEVLAHLIASIPAHTLAERVREALLRITGTYGIAVIDRQQPDSIVVARNGSPVVLGLGANEMFVASDFAALVRHTQTRVDLDDGEIAVVRADGFETFTLDGGATDKTPTTFKWTEDSYDKGSFEHFMRKEIAEQPDAVRRTLSGRLDVRFHTTRLGGVELAARELLEVRRIKLLGCGSAFIAASAGAHLIEQISRVPAHAEPASEFRYRNPVIEQDTLYIAVSQSGETLDTLLAIQEIKRKGGRVLGVVNAVGSAIARECGRGVYLHAGPEVAVVSTKTFTCTVVALALLAVHLGRIRDLSTADGARLVNGLQALPDQIALVLEQDAAVSEIASQLASCENAYFVGRAAGYAVAMEGALKLKEVSYVHAEAYPASELKHGPLALITRKTPTVVVIPRDDLLAKNLSTVEEIKAREGQTYVVTEQGSDLPISMEGLMEVPATEPELAPLLLNLPLQLLAYHVALTKGCNIDQPRNLAKSVTVE
jgi:glutamine---fructose-6-phosphate transaminase (isomerizing)